MCGRPVPERTPPSAGHCLGTTEPGRVERRLSSRRPGSAERRVSRADWDRRPERRLSGADWDRRPSGRPERRRDAATQPGNDATPQGTHKGCPYGHRGIGPTGRLETALPVGDWKSPLLAKNTGCVKHAPPSRRVKHAAPSGARKDAGPSRRRGRRRSRRASGIGSFKEKEEGGDRKVPPPGPARNRAGIDHQRRPPRCRCRTTRRGDPCVVALPPNGHHRPPAIAWALPNRGGGAATF